MNEPRRLRRSVKGLPRGKRSQLFRAVEDILRDNDDLARTVKTWRSYEGQADDLVDPTPDQCPWVRLHLEKRPITPSGEEGMIVEVGVVIELATAGTCQDDILDLWEAIEVALSVISTHRGVSVRDWLRDHAIEGPDGSPRPREGGYEFRFEEPAIFPSGPSREDLTMLAGVGKFLCVTRKPA